MKYDDAQDRMMGDEEMEATDVATAVEEKPEAQGEIGDPNALRVVLAAMKILYDKKTSDSIVKMLRGGDPVRSLANTTLFVMRMLYEQSKKAMPVDAALTAADSIVDLMAELAQAAGVEIDDAGIEQAKAAVVQTLQQKMGQQTQQQAAGQVMPMQQGMGQRPPGLIAGAMA